MQGCELVNEQSKGKMRLDLIPERNTTILLQSML